MVGYLYFFLYASLCWCCHDGDYRERRAFTMFPILSLRQSWFDCINDTSRCYLILIKSCNRADYQSVLLVYDLSSQISLLF